MGFPSQPGAPAPGSQKLALGAVATGATGLTIHHNTKAREPTLDALLGSVMKVVMGFDGFMMVDGGQ